MNRTKNGPGDTTNTMKSLIAQLDSKDRAITVNAHKSLVDKGESAVRLLVEALSNPSDRVRREAGKILDEINVDWSHHSDITTVNFLISELGSDDGLVRVRARQNLVTIGAKSVTALVEALKSKYQGMRWEAAKALGKIADTDAIGALIRALEDEMFDVRWLAAEGLTAIGRPVLVPLMSRLTEKTDSLWLREGVHHILFDIHQTDLEDILRPVLNALEDVEAPLEVPLAAQTALSRMKDVR